MYGTKVILIQTWNLYRVVEDRQTESRKWRISKTIWNNVEQIQILSFHIFV